MIGGDRDVSGFGEAMQVDRWTPEFELGNDARLVAGLQHSAIALHDRRERNLRAAVRAGGWRGDPFAADLRDHVHLAFGLIQAGGAAGRIVSHPRSERDRALYRQSLVGDALPEI